MVVLCDFIEVLLLALLSYWIPMNPGSLDTSNEDVWNRNLNLKYIQRKLQDL